MERIIDSPNPQPFIRNNAEKARDWEFKDEAQYLYQKAIVLRERLIDPIARIDRGQLPDPVIGFENLRNYKVLAEYLLYRDAVGLTCRINMNTEQYEEKDGNKVWRWGRWAQLETLTHEYIHLWQQTVGERPFKPSESVNSHNQEFIEKCESIGLHPMPVFGCHVAVADAPFSILMKEWGIERPDNVPTLVEGKLDWFKLGKEQNGKSSLSKWSCGCQNVRVGTKDFFATCDKCNRKFEKVERRQVIYSSSSAPSSQSPKPPEDTK